MLSSFHVKLYTSFVHPVVEYACAVWGCAALSAKTRLDTVQRVALRVATGATFSSGTDALQVYCNVLPLQLRRDMFTVSAFQFIIRLGVRHPVFRLFRSWQSGCGVSTRHSIFCRASAVLRRLSGFSLFDDGGAAWVE
jgi:hypothetical protein